MSPTTAAYLVVEVSDVAAVRGEIAVRLSELGGTRQQVLDAQMIAGELLVNALVHGGTEAQLVLVVEDGVRVEVHDGGPGLPVLRPADPTVVGGNGILIVNGLAASWGVTPSPMGGKAVWAQLSLR